MSRALVALVVVVAAVVSACPSRRDGLSRDALERSLRSAREAEELPEIDALLRWRIPALPPQPTLLTGRLAEQALLRGADITIANDDDDDDDADLLRCLRADAQRDYPAIVKHCSATVRARPDDLRTAIVVGLLGRHLAALDDDTRTALAATVGDASAMCRSKRASCAWLTAVSMRFVGAVAEQTSATVGDDDSVRTFNADGPFAAVHFKRSNADAAEMVPHPQRALRTLRAEGPRVYPARRGGRGWYRLTSDGAVATAGSANVFITGGGATQVLVDGVVVHTRSTARSAATIEWVPLELEAGAHRLEVLAWDGGEGLAVAVIDDAGRNMWQHAAPGPNRVARSARGKDRGWATALLLPATVDGGDAHAFVVLALRHHAARAGLGSDDELAALTTTMVQSYGWSPVALMLAAQAIEDDDLPERFASGLTAPMWQAAHNAWPTAPLPLLAQARATKAETPDAALAAYRALVDVAPGYPQGRRELLPLLLEQGLVDEANDVAQGLLALGHTSENVEAALPALRAAGEQQQAAALLEQRAVRSPDRRWRHLLRQGDVAAARVVLAQLINGDGEDASDAVDALLELDELATPQRALSLLSARDDVPPERRLSLQLRAARLLADAGGESTLASLLSMTTSLEALTLAVAVGVPAPWAHLEREGDAVIARRRSGTAPFGEWPLVFLHSANEHHFADDGSALVLRHWLVEVRTKQAIDGIGELKKDNDELLLRLRVHKPDGAIVEPEHHNNIDAISLTGLAPGDVVEWLSATVDSSGVGGAAVSQQRLPPYATEAWRFVVSTPTTLSTTRQLRIEPFNGAPAPQVSSSAGRSTTTFSAVNIAARRTEPFAVNADDEQPLIVVSLNFNDDVVRRLRASALLGSDGDGWVRRVAQHVAQRGNDDDKLRKLFRFVAERITEADSPGDAIGTLATGRGRRLPLLLALMRAADLAVAPVALHNVFDGPSDRPAVGLFPTTALVVETPERHIIADIGDVLVLDRLPVAYAGAVMLNLDDGTRSNLPSTELDPEAVEVRVDLTLAADAARLSGLVAVKVPTLIADQLRSGIRAATAEQLAHFIESGLAASFPGVVATNVTTPDLDAVAQPLTFVADIAVDVDPSTVRFEHVFSQGAAAAFRAAFPLGVLVQVAQRETTLRARPQRERLELTMHLPAAASFVDVPPTTRLVAGPVTFDQRTSVTDGVLVWQRTIDVTAEAVPPASWATVRAALAPVLAAADGRVGCVRALPITQPGGGASR